MAMQDMLTMDNTASCQAVFKAVMPSCDRIVGSPEDRAERNLHASKQLVAGNQETCAAQGAAQHHAPASLRVAQLCEVGGHECSKLII